MGTSLFSQEQPPEASAQKGVPFSGQAVTSHTPKWKPFLCSEWYPLSSIPGCLAMGSPNPGMNSGSRDRISSVKQDCQ